MNKTEYLLTCLSEECAEISQRASKAIRFGLAEKQVGQEMDNASRLCEEVVDLLCVLELVDKHCPELRNANDFDPDKCREVKLAKLEKYMAYSRAQGTLVD